MIYITHFRAKKCVSPDIIDSAARVRKRGRRARIWTYNYANFTVPVIYWDSYGGGGKEENTEKAYIMVWITH